MMGAANLPWKCVKRCYGGRFTVRTSINTGGHSKEKLFTCEYKQRLDMYTGLCLHATTFIILGINGIMFMNGKCLMYCCFLSEHSRHATAAVAEWLRAWDTLTMFEATVCGRS